MQPLRHLLGGWGYPLVIGVVLAVGSTALLVVVGGKLFVDRVSSYPTAPVDEVGPSWSPDGIRVAFASNQGDSYDIYVQNADGTGRINVTNSPEEDTHPVWSPDGSLIAFLSSGIRGTDIRVVRPDGVGSRNLTNFPALYTQLAWSPDGAKLAFQSTRDGNSELYMIGVDGKGLTRLSDNDFVDIDPAWSPDGTQIAFASRQTQSEFGEHLRSVARSDPLMLVIGDGTVDSLVVGMDFDIYVMNADGSEQTNLSQNPETDDTRPVWSPDGRYVAFDGRYTRVAATAPGSVEIYLLRVGGIHGVKPLTETSLDRNRAGVHHGPVWSPDGAVIAYMSRDDEMARVNMIRLDFDARDLDERNSGS